MIPWWGFVATTIVTWRRPASAGRLKALTGKFGVTTRTGIAPASKAMIASHCSDPERRLRRLSGSPCHRSVGKLRSRGPHDYQQRNCPATNLQPRPTRTEPYEERGLGGSHEPRGTQRHSVK